MRVFLLFGFVYLFCRFLLLRFYVHLGSMPYAQLHSDHVIELIQIWAIKKTVNLKADDSGFSNPQEIADQASCSQLSSVLSFYFSQQCSLFHVSCSLLPAPFSCSQLFALCPQLPALCSEPNLTIVREKMLPVLCSQQGAERRVHGVDNRRPALHCMITFLTYRLCRCRQDRPPSKMRRAPVQLVSCPSPPSQTSFPLVLAIPTYPNPMHQSGI